jgi:hypothetical protein
MLILTIHWDVRAIWSALTVTARLYFICLVAGSACSTYSFARIGWNLRQMRKRLISTDKNEAMVRLRQMARKARTLQQLHTLLFLLFGVCSANEVFAGLRAIQNSLVSLSALGIDEFGPFVAFAFVVFTILSILHMLWWAADYGLQSATAEADRHSHN